MFIAIEKMQGLLQTFRIVSIASRHSPQLAFGKSVSTHIGIPGLEDEEGDVEHTPIFSQAILDHLLPLIRNNEDKNVPTKCLDMTFGTGGHTSLILDHGLHLTRSLSILAADRDWSSFQAAQKMSTRYSTGRLVPLQSKFSQLPHKLSLVGNNQKFDAIILQTGVSNLQRNDSSRGFCPRRKGTLDMRMDEPTDVPKIPTASEVLQHIDERSLIKLLKVYGGLKTKARFVAEAILEARYMFHQFKTTQELYDVIGTASRNFYAKSSSSRSYQAKCNNLNERDIRIEMMERTVTALRLFVNNELNELDFGVRNVAERYLKHKTGLLFVIVDTPPEEKIVRKCLFEVEIQNQINKTWEDEEVFNLQKRPWNVFRDVPMHLSQAEKTLHPRFLSSMLYIAQRTAHEVNRISS